MAMAAYNNCMSDIYLLAIAYMYVHCDYKNIHLHFDRVQYRNIIGSKKSPIIVMLQ